MNTKPLISIIIRTYNEERHLHKLMHGIENQTEKNVEVIVVDSGSTDRTVSIATQYGAKVIHISKSEFTFGRSLNIGCEAAEGEFLVIASGHVYPVRKDWLALMVAPMADPQVAVVYGRQIGNEQTKFSEHMLFEQWFPRQGSGHQMDYFCNNANSAIRKSDWETNKFDEKLTGLEDLKYSKSFFENGRKVSYQSSAAIVHVHDEDWPRIRNRYRREAIAMKQIDEKMKFGFGQFILYFVRHTFSDIASAYKSKVLSKNAMSIVLFRFNQFLGSYRGFHESESVTEDMRRRFYYPNLNFKSDDQLNDEAVAINYSGVAEKQSGH